MVGASANYDMSVADYLESKSWDKRVKYEDQCKKINSDFIPFALDTFGGFHKSAIDHIKTLAERWGRSREMPRGMPRGMATQQIITRISVALRNCIASHLVSRGDDGFLLDWDRVIPPVL